MVFPEFPVFPPTKTSNFLHTYSYLIPPYHNTTTYFQTLGVFHRLLLQPLLSSLPYSFAFTIQRLPFPLRRSFHSVKPTKTKSLIAKTKGFHSLSWTLFNFQSGFLSHQYHQVGGASLQPILLHPTTPWTKDSNSPRKQPQASITGLWGAKTKAQAQAQTQAERGKHI